MSVSSKRILSIGAALILLVVAGIVYTTLITREFRVISEKRGIVQSKSALFDNQSSAVDQVKKIIGEFQNFAQLEETIKLALPSDPQSVLALRQIKSIANLSGVNLTGVTFKVATPKTANKPLVKKLGNVEISLSATGSYEGLKSFLQKLETMVRVANVSKLEYTAAPPRGGVQFDTLNLGVKVYFEA